MEASGERLCKELGYQFHDPDLVQRALTHRSAGSPNNERLEFLGDAILGCVVAEALYGRFPEASEGQLSRLRALLVRRESLAELARGLDLGSALKLGSGELRTGGHSRDSILADALEAMLAAVYLDGTYAEARRVILGLFRSRLDGLGLESQRKDPKTHLQEYLQSRGLPLPGYEITQVHGEAHAQHFQVRCSVAGLDIIEVQGTGSSRKKAEQDAAKRLLKQIETPKEHA